MKTRRQTNSPVLTGLLLALMLGLLAACSGGAARTSYARGEEAAQRELWDHAVLAYAKASALEPSNSRYKVALARAKLRSSAAHFDRAKRYLANGQLELAIDELQETVILDPSNQYAAVELQKALTEQERRRKGPSEYDMAKREAARRAKDFGPPKLDAASNIPIILNFPDSTIGEVYETLSKSSGINFIYDEKLDKKKKVGVELSNVTFEKAMDILMLQNKHFYKVIDAHTILIADDTRQKRAEYADQVIRTFYLSNAETKQVQTLVRALLETRRIHENQDLNAITIKDTPEVIKIAERVIKANDKAKGEVVVDLELLEINRNKLQRLGLDLSSKSLSLVFGQGNESLTLNALDALKSKAAWSVGPVPSVLLNFLKTDSDSKSIAKPQLRILEGEDGKITIGDRVPIPATTFNSSQTIGGNVVPITSFTYQNVGIIVDVKPRVHHNKEITLELKLEISSLAGTVEGTGGVSQPIIGTRTIETTIRLKDGETNLLAGLIKQDERSSLSGVPGLSDIPFLRRLFGANEDAKQTTDIVMAVTPHILRVPNIEPIDLVPLWVGTEERLQLRGVARNALGESPFAGQRPWDEIDRELMGDQPEGYEEGGARVKLDAEPADHDSAAEEETGSQQRKRRRRGEPEALPDDGVFDEEQPDVDLEAADQDAEARPKEVKDEPRRPAVAQVRMAADRTRVAAGEAFGVEMVVSGAEDVGQVNFQLRYDPEVLRFVPPAEPGAFLQQGGARVDLQAVESAEGGLIVVSAARAGEVGASGSGGLVRLNFIALAPGEAGFTISAASVRSPDSRAQPASFRRTSVEVTP
ncbi:MAG TPA: hypothetical protein ENK10_01080 [Acidobacteria bacterium]|nr:hypothetical protein [Acidobacteriota bacterium]